jgi:hypothetical protein
MPNVATLVLEYFVLGISLVLLVWGVGLLVYLRRHGGFELGLTHVVADPHRRSVFLWALATSLTAFVSGGFAEGFETLTGASGLGPKLLNTALFGIGALGILLLMANALRPSTLSTLTLEEQWTLKENLERSSLAPAPVIVAPGVHDPPERGMPWPPGPGR